MTDLPYAETLEARPGVAVAVRQAGDGEPVVVLHGTGGPHTIDPLLAHLAGGNRVLAPTHPGWDGTTRPAELTNVADLAAAYLDLLAAQGLSRVTIAGVSFGGWIAAEMALADRDQRIGRLVLIDALGPQIPGHRLATPTTVTPTNRAALRAYIGDSLEDPTLLDRVSALTIPILVAWGENDPVINADFGRRYAEALPGAYFTLIPGAGHLPFRDAPEATFATIDAFL
jgi:pimeloyl-ACP methyl ester carboxylesterase